MTSMFDQFEQEKSKPTYSTAEMSNLGYFNVSLEQDTPIFSKTRKDFTPADKVTHVAISNKYMVVAMANNVLFRMDLQQPQNHDEITLTKYAQTGRLSNLFLDHTGNHLLLTFSPKTVESSSELLYLTRKSTKLKASARFRGHEVTDVGWNNLNDSEATTGRILLGTSKGLIFETEIVLESDNIFSSSLEQYWKQLPNYLPLTGARDIDGLIFDVGKGTNTPITGLEYFRIPLSDKFCIFVATPSRLYYFTGRANYDEKPLLQIFNRYLNIPESETFIEVQSNLRYSRLKFWSENLMVPDSFAWLTEEGVIHAKIDLNTLDVNYLKTKKNFIPFPKPLYEDFSVLQKPPFALVLTEFHVLLGYTDTIKGISLLNKELVYEDNYNEAFGRLINVIKDRISGEIWAITENSLFRFKVTKEERNVWQIYCENQQFDLAKKYSRGNELFYNQVLIKEADMLFNEGKYIESAERYAETQSSFEEVCLKFIKVNEEQALNVFLKKKLDNLEQQDKTQITMIVLWVIELYLGKLEELRLSNKEQTTAFDELQKDFAKFLALPRVADCVKRNKRTIYDLMASHGDKDNLIKFTIVNKDFEQLIRQHLYKNNYLEALQVLKSQNNRELFYQFSPVLMQEVPKYTVKALIEQGRNLVPVKLLPTLVSCDDELHSREVITYLEFCVDTLKNTEKAIHNLLISLYAKYDPQKLMKYLEAQGRELLMINYDVHFALRLCHERKLTQACVHLTSLLGLWESAVDLALNISIDLAKQIANMPPQSEVELRKKLWLKIAQHVVSGKDDIEQAMEFLKECDLIRIEDILPFFSDFVTIDHFREAICNSLKEYNQRIQDLKEEMEEATQSAELVRGEIQSFRNRYTFISSNDNCDICNLTLMVRCFYMFPCKHRFHTDCLLKELTQLLGPAKRNKLDDLNRQLKILNAQGQGDNLSTGSTGMSAKEMVKAEIDNIVASECLYCGENMIRNIDKPFIEENEYEKIMKEWE